MDISSVGLSAFCFRLPRRPVAMSCTQVSCPGRSSAASPGLKPPPGFAPRASSLHTFPPPTSPRVSVPSAGRRGTSPCLAGCGAAYVLGSAPCLLFIRFLRVNLCFHRCPSVSFSSSLPSPLCALAGAGGARGPHPRQLQLTPGGWKAFRLPPPLLHGWVLARALFLGGGGGILV